MPRFSRAGRRNLALLAWALGIMLFIGLGFWNLDSARRDVENRMIGESARMAGQIATIISTLNSDMEPRRIRPVVDAVMENDNVYAVKIETFRGELEGKRRNYLWEPVAWDDEIAENCIQGMNPIKIGGHNVGTVEVWISPRLSAEEDGMLRSREETRFLVLALFWTTGFMLLFWQWGDLRRLGKIFRKKSGQGETAQSRVDISALKSRQKSGNDNAAEKGDSGEGCQAIVDAEAGRRFQRRNPQAWSVTAGMFRQTFACGPSLISRLYAAGQIAGLCHLGRMLEQAAPCVGAAKLAKAARDMQAALNDPDCSAHATPVEECAAALDEVLAALDANGKRYSKPDCARS